MRIIVVSDSHRRISLLEEVAERHQDDMDYMIFLGDVLDDAAYLPEWFPNIKLCTVRGNCDYSADAPLTGLLKAGGKRVFYTHGHQYFVKQGTATLEKVARAEGADVVLYGHTHLPHAEYKDGLYILNPGSIGNPREGKPSYGIVDITPAGILTNICYI